MEPCGGAPPQEGVAEAPALGLGAALPQPENAQPVQSAPAAEAERMQPGGEQPAESAAQLEALSQSGAPSSADGSDGGGEYDSDCDNGLNDWISGAFSAAIQHGEFLRARQAARRSPLSYRSVARCVKLLRILEPYCLNCRTPATVLLCYISCVPDFYEVLGSV